MATFLDDLSIYNAKAAAAITLAASTGDSGKANLMSSLKSTANDTTLTEAVRLNALTALINVGNLLDIPLPPYFPITTTFANSQTYVGVHNDLSGLNVGDFQHLTSAEKSAALNKASLSDITFANLIGVYTDNASLVGGFALKQDALSGLGYIKANGGSITYDNSTFLTSVTGIVAANTPGGGQITGTYASPTLSNAAVIGQLLTGFNPSAATGVLSNTDSIFSAIETLNANVENVIATSGTINEITFALPSSVFDFTAGPFTSGAAPLSGTFLDQSQNYFFAGPTSGGTGQPTFRAIVPGDFPVSGATAGTYGSASSIPVIQVDTYGRVTTIANVTAASGGQVNTITYSVPAGVFTQSVTGTSAVSITLGLSTQTATYVWAGPVSGAVAGPTFRALVSTDIPSISLDQVDGLYAYLDFYLPNALATSAMFIGNGSDAAVNATVTGDLALLYVDNAPTNEAEFTIQPGVVSYAKIQDVTGQKLLGRYALADGEAQEITFDSLAFTLNSTTGVLGLVTPNPPTLTTKGDLLTATGPSTQVRLGIGANATLFMADSAVSTGNKWVAMSGDATIATSGAITIGAGAVTFGKMATLAANSFIGNNTGSAATPIALTVTQATAMLNQFTTSLKGLVPGVTGPAIGDATYFLNATGAWSVPAGGGGGGTVSSGSQYQLAYYAANGTTVSGLTLITASRALVSDANGLPVASSVSTTQIEYLSSVTGTTGTTNTNLVFSASPTFTGTPVLSTATATSINKVEITAPATSATLTIADGKTLTISNTLTFTGTDGSSVAFGAGGTVAYIGLANSWTSGIKQTFAPSATNAGINVGTLAGQPSSPVNGDLVYNSTATALQAYINGAWVSLGAGGGGGSGTVNSGTQYQLAYYATTGTAVSGLTTGTNGQVLALSAGLVPTWTTLGTSTTLTNIGAATASNTPLANAAGSIITWNWHSNTTTNSFVLGSTGLTSGSLLTLTHTTSAFTGNLASFTSSSVSSGTLLNLGITGTGASAKNLVITNASSGNTSGRGIDVLISGTTAAATTYGAYISNTKLTGTAAYALYLNTSATATTNYGLQINTSGGTTNYAIDVVAGISRFGVGTASVPQLILTPSTAAGGTTFTGIVNGSLWYDTNSTITNSSLTLYKDSAPTKILTKDRNPDFITSAQGVVVADASGNFTKSADLTALGIFAQTNDVPVVNTTTATTLIGTIVGSATLPANFFAAGKTIIIFISGTYAQTSGSNTCTLNFSIGGVAVGSIALNHNNTLSATYFETRVVLTCRTAGASGTVQYQGCGLLNNSTNPTFYYQTSATSGSINTTTTNAINVTATWSAANASNSLIAGINIAQYIN